MPATAKRKYRWIIAAALSSMLAGAALAASAIWHSANALSSMIRVAAPGNSTIAFPKAGKYTFFYEYDSMVAGRVYRGSSTTPTIEMTLRSLADGSNVELRDPTVEKSYSHGGFRGRSLVAANIASPGQYEFVARDSQPGRSPFIIAIGQGTSFQGLLALISVLAGGGLAAIGFGTITVLAVVVTLRRISKAAAGPERG